MTKLNVIFSKDDGRARSKISKAWIYWREGDKKLVLRADDQGRVFQFSTGDPKDPSSYKDPFITDDGVEVDAAYNEDVAQLVEESIKARLSKHTTAQSLSASLAALGPVFVTAGGGKKTVPVLPLAEIRLPKHQKFLRAVAVTTFGGTDSDVHAKNMDRFIATNYGTSGGTAKEFRGNEEKGFREELRRVVQASGPQPIDIIRDIETAAKAVVNDDADERIVALALHGNVDRIGRRLRDFFLVDSSLTDLNALKGDTALARGRLKAAEDKLVKAKASGKAEDIQAAQAEVDSRRALLAGFDQEGLKMLDAFDKAAEQLKASQVQVIELQACDSGAGSGGVAALGFIGKLNSFLSAKGHSVTVKGHSAAIFTRGTKTEVSIWIGRQDQEGLSGTQTSKTSLPLPAS